MEDIPLRRTFELLQEEFQSTESNTEHNSQKPEVAQKAQPITYEQGAEKLPWQIATFGEDTMMIAENVTVPDWYLEGGCDSEEAEHRRPAIIIRQHDQETIYEPAWIFLSERTAYKTFPPCPTVGEAELVISKHWQDFASSSSREEFDGIQARSFKNSL
ncbi:hypothetical protein IAD21_06039 [Abditibacteriota bacterium]|nr:hypothetical protein IAD21_06039 [Abditibacteriota bacterium]